MRIISISLVVIAFVAISMWGCSANKTGDEKLTSDQQHIKNVVNLRNHEMMQIYEKYYSYKPQSGSLKIKLFITDLGTVQNAELTVDTGSLTPEFISEIKAKLLSWQFIISKPTIYSYKITFKK